MRSVTLRKFILKICWALYVEDFTEGFAKSSRCVLHAFPAGQEHPRATTIDNGP